MMSQTTDVDLDRFKGMSILLAEDNVTNQLVATQMLESLGAEVDVASDGAIALERVKKRGYDVLLIDIEMPRVSGLDVIRSIRADSGPLASTPAIALTAYAMQEHREKILGVGADGLIPKPIISINQFAADILGYMDGRRARAEAPADAGGPHQARIERALYDSFATSLGSEAMTSILKRAETDLVAQRSALATGVKERDCEIIERASHIIVSLAGMVGGVKLQEQAEALNGLARDGEEDNACALAQMMAPELDGVLDFVRAEREALSA